MDRYVARANIDHYLGLLDNADLPAQNRSTVTNLRVAEEDKLAHDLEQFEFAESKVAESRDRVERLRRLRAAFIEGSSERQQADRLLRNAEGIHDLIEQFCHHLRARVNSRSL